MSILELVRRGLIKQTFGLWQSLGIHVTPNHYYEPIPDTRTLSDKLWSTPSEMVGIDLQPRRQIELLDRFVADFKVEYDQFPTSRPSEGPTFFTDNQVFLGVDAEVLYCMVRHFKPHRIVEVGSGYSTLLSAQAIRKNRDEDPSYACELVSIDPSPPAMLNGDVPGLTRLIRSPVQDVPLSELTDLGANDILFIDSSHVLRIGSDVQYEFLEALPRLPVGALAHLHDIFLPMEYPQEWVLQRHRFWNEQYVLQAFLAFNNSFEVVWAGSYMHRHSPDKLAAAFRTYRRDERWRGRHWLPGSFWMRRIR